MRRLAGMVGAVLLAALCAGGLQASAVDEGTPLIPADNVEQFVVEKLDLSTFRNSLGPRREPGMRFFADFDLKPTKITKGLIEFDKESWYYAVRIDDRRDVNGDGLEDLVVTFIDDAKEGTYRTGEKYLLTRFSEQGHLVALAYNPDPILDRE